jgi:hypothetical protein
MTSLWELENFHQIAAFFVAKMVLDTSTPKCIMLQRTKLITALRRVFGS